ncbi:retrovirus-related pol polyprotein from transposon TNT 1-94 [Tanacetum coccineum]
MFFSKNNQLRHGNQFGNGGNRYGKDRSNSFGNKGDESARQKGVCYNCGVEGHFASKCTKPKENKVFVGRAWSDSEDGDEPQNDAIYLMEIDSQKVQTKPYISNNGLDIIDFQKENEELLRTDNGTEFVNQTLKAYYEEVRILHQTSAARTPQQNVVTTCCTQNRSLIRKRHNKTSYELLHDLKPDLPYLHVVGALCYPTNDSEDLGKLKPKANIRIFIGYAPTKKAFRIYNKRTHLIIETIHVDFDEMSAMASE